MAGTINLSMTQQFDPLGNPLSGGKLYGIVAGTVSTPQNFFQDLALTLAWPNPITLDVAGRVPQLFIADGLIKIRLTDSAGVVQLSADNIQVIGASSGGGGGGAIDATTVAATGDLKTRYGVGALTGWVRCNNLTIGSSISGATERANADTQALFQYLWGVDVNLAVSGGRGGTSLADWNANKQLTVPDWRGYLIGGLDDMGNSAAGRLTATYFGTAATVLGAAGGSQSNTLTTAQLASHRHPAFINEGASGHSHNLIMDGTAVGSINFTQVGSQGTAGTAGRLTTDHTLAVNAAFTGVRVTDGVSIFDSTATAGSGQPYNTTQPTKLATVYIKL